MNSYNIFITFVVAALIATTSANPSGYGDHESGPSYGQGNSDHAAASAGPSHHHAGDYAEPAQQSYNAPSYGQSYGPQSIPYAPKNTRGNLVTSSISYPQNKGEILIHRPAAIIVKRPPTKVVVNHPPLVVKPAPVVLHKPPAVVLRKVLVKHHPRPVKVEPVYVNVVKPPAEKYFVNEKVESSAPPASFTAPAAHGYQLLDSKDGLAALAGSLSAGGNSAHYGPANGAQY